MTADLPRFALLKVGQANVIDSITDPDDPHYGPGLPADERERATLLRARAAVLTDSELKWIADNQLEVGGVGAVDIQVIGDMAYEPDETLRDLCHRLYELKVPAAALREAEASRLARSAAGQRVSFHVGPEDLYTVINEVLDAVAARAAAPDPASYFPIHLLTRAELLQFTAGYRESYRPLWEGATDAELELMCLIENAVIHEGDDTSEELYYTFEELLKTLGELPAPKAP
jgi:hypothetical protein